MFRHITMGQARDRLNKGYCYQYVGANDDNFYQINLDKIAEWSDEVEMKIFTTPGFFYFDSHEDMLNFRLRWC